MEMSAGLECSIRKGQNLGCQRNSCLSRHPSLDSPALALGVPGALLPSSGRRPPGT